MKKILLILFCMILLIGAGTILSTRNVGEYNEQEQTMVIRDSALSDQVLAEVQLKTPQVVYVIRGKDRKVAEFEINNIEKSYSKIFTKMEFYDVKKNMKELDRDFTYKYKKSLGFETINDYETVCVDGKEFANGTILQDCHQELTGTHQEERFEWIKLDTSKELPTGEITIGVFTDVLPNEEVEWIPTLFGVRINPWAVWKDSFEVDIVAWWALEEISGSTAFDFYGQYNLTYNDTLPTAVSGILGNGQYLDGTDDYIIDGGTLWDTSPDNGSISIWFNSDLSQAGKLLTKLSNQTNPNKNWLIVLVNTGNKVYAEKRFNGVNKDLTSTTNYTTGNWFHVVVTWGSDGFKLYVNGGVAEDTDVDTNAWGSGSANGFSIGVQNAITGNTDEFNGIIDDAGIWSRQLNESEVGELYDSGTGITPSLPDAFPTVTLNSPVNAYNTTVPTIDFNCTASDDVEITKVSLLINGTIEQTNTSGINGTDYLFTKILTTAGFYNWSCIAYDSANQSTTANVRNLTYSNDLAVSLVSPVAGYNSTSISINFNGTASDDAALINVSLYVDGVLNQTNSSGINATYYLFTSSLSDGNHNWTYRACDVVSCLSATTRLLTVNTTPDIQFVSPTYANATNSTSSYVPVNVTVTETYFKNITFSFYNGTTTSYFFDNNTRFINITLADDSYNYNVTVWTTTGQRNTTTTRNITIDATLPAINITYPVATVTYHIINTNLTLNWTATDPNIDKCWHDYNGTNLTVTCSDNTTGINITDYENNNVTFYANDTFGNLNSFYREWGYKIFENYQTFSSTTIEGSTETYVNNIFLGSGETITEINFDYNGTDRSASYLSLGGNEYNLSSTFIIPSVVAETNITFFWEIVLISGQVNTSIKNQTVKAIAVDNCDTYPNVIFSYTIIDEESQAVITNGTSLELTLEIFDSSKTVSILNFSTEYINTNPATVCLSINLTNETTYTLDSTAKYEAINYTGNKSVNYSVEYYNIQSFILRNSTIPQVINLFDLLLEDSTEFQVTFKDSNFVTVENALIQISRQYVSEGLFKTVEIPKTDSNGQTVAHLVEKDIVYNIVVLKDGVVLGTFNNVIAFCEDIIIGSCFISLNALERGEISFDYDEDIELLYLFDYNETSRNLQFDFSTTDGSVKNVTLSALQIDQLGNTTVCNGYLISSSGSILCSVPVAVGNETIIVSIFVDVDLRITNYIQAGRKFDIGDSGYFLMFFLVLSLALMMTQSKTGVIVGVILGFISGVLLSLIQGGLMGIGSSVIWLIIMGVILIYKLNSQGQT